MPAKSKKDDLIEFSLMSSSNRPGTTEIFREIFTQIGIKLHNILEANDGVNFKTMTYVRSSAQAEDLKKRLHALRLRNTAIRLKTLPPRDWQQKGKGDFRPFALTTSLDVVPMAQRKSYQPRQRSPIYIETANVFGSGLHETTQFMAELIEQCSGKFKDFLDIGTGTGILSLVALKSQGQEVSAIDMDRRCLKAAKNNLRDNGYAFKEFYVTDIKRFGTKRKYDFVAANLITAELIQARRRLVALTKTGKYLAISGIMLENFAGLKKAYRLLSLRCLKIKKGKQWVAVLYKKTENRQQRIENKNGSAK